MNMKVISTIDLGDITDQITKIKSELSELENMLIKSISRGRLKMDNSRGGEKNDEEQL